MHSSKRADWGTPASLFEPLHKEFNFFIDVAAEAHNKKCPAYFGPDHRDECRRDAMKWDWYAAAALMAPDARLADYPAVFMNPPYSVKGKMPIQPWLVKAAVEAAKGLTVVGIIPANVQTRWWQTWVRAAYEVRFLTHRVAFEAPPGVEDAGNTAGHNVAVVIWKPLVKLGYVKFFEPSYRYAEYR